MNVIYPFPFTVDYRKDAGATISTMTQVGYVSADVPSVTDGDVIELATWIEEVGYPRERVLRSCVMWNGDPYAQVVDQSSGVALGHLPQSPSGLSPYGFTKAMMGDGNLTGSEISAWEKAHERQAASVRNVSDVVRSNMARNSETVTACLRSLLVIDGEVWMKVPDIGIKLCESSIGIGKIAMVDLGVRGFDSLRGSELSNLYGITTRRFGLYEADRLRHHAGGAAITFEYAQLRSQNSLPLRFNSENRFVARALDYFVGSTADGVGDMPAARLADWLRLKDAIKAHSEQREAFSDDTPEVLRRFSAQIRDSRLYHLAEEVCDIMDLYASEERPALALETKTMTMTMTRKPA